jgi:adenylate cyclase
LSRLRAAKISPKSLKVTNDLIAKVSGKFPLRTVLIVPFILQIIAAVGLVGYLSFRNGQQAVNNLVTQLQQGVNARVKEKIHTYLEVADQVNKANASAFDREIWNFNDFSSQQQQAWEQMQISSWSPMTIVGFGNTRGGHRAVERLQDGTLVIRAAADNGGIYTTYATNAQGHPTKVISTSNPFDSRTRPWYIVAVQARNSAWTSIYPHIFTGELLLALSSPIYDKKTKDLLGVTYIIRSLDDISKFLRQIEISQSGKIFIMERDGLLVATSTTEKPYIRSSNVKNQKRLAATSSSNALIRLTAQYLNARYGNLAFAKSEQLNFTNKERRYFVQVTTLYDERGLDWLIVTVIPEADFMQEINANNRTTFLLCIAALSGAILVGMVTSRWIVEPILRLNIAAKEIAKGHWDNTVEIKRKDEVGQLAISFNIMADQLHKLFSILEEQNAQMKRLNEALSASEIRLKQLLEAVPVGIFVVDNNGKPFYINSRAQQLLGKTIIPNDTGEQLRDVYPAYLANSEDTYPPERDPIFRALQGESVNVDDMEIRQDKIIPLEVWGRPIYDEKGKITYAIAAFIDITERKQAEAERQKLIEELFELNCTLELSLEAELKLTQAARRFVPNEFLSLLGHQSLVDVQLGDQVQQEISILFADIRDFTSFSEGMTPEDNFRFINAYLKRMEPAIAENNGFIDKYMGDGIMALFSGGVDDAVKAGITMQQVLRDYNIQRISYGYIPIRIGIGINTGYSMLGTVGGKNRMDGTVISDAVNLASRVEGLTKYYGVSMLITQQSFLQLNEPIYAIRPIDLVQVKGKSASVMVYEVFEADPPEVKALKLANFQIFISALYNYRLNKLKEAEQLFTDCLRQNPMDKVAQIYLKRCQQDEAGASIFR